MKIEICDVSLHALHLCTVKDYYYMVMFQLQSVSVNERPSEVCGTLSKSLLAIYAHSATYINGTHYPSYETFVCDRPIG